MTICNKTTGSSENDTRCYPEICRSKDNRNKSSSNKTASDQGMDYITKRDADIAK